MEDAHVVVVRDRYAMFGVFDGHAGDTVSKALEKQLPDAIDREVGPLFQSAPPQNAPQAAIMSSKLQEVLENVYVELDKKLYDIEAFADARQRYTGATMVDWKKGSGSTAIVVLRHGDALYFVNLGDSRALLVEMASGKVVLHTKDHKPTDDDEIRRIKNSGGFVFKGRVGGMLAVSRAFGDFGLKRSREIPDGYAGKSGWVSPVPVVTHTLLEPERQYCLVLACDGLFDVMTNDEVGTWVKDYEVDSTESSPSLCTSLVLEALSRHSKDNVSVLTVPMCCRRTGLAQVATSNQNLLQQPDHNDSRIQDVMSRLTRCERDLLQTQEELQKWKRQARLVNASLQKWADAFTENGT